jgi:hypothetical protein
MADTGAPWNIPYVEPTDLVRQYPAADEAQALAIAAGLSAAGNPGIGSNVVQTQTTTNFSTSSTSLTDFTNVEVTITPTSDTSLILVILTVGVTLVSVDGVTREVVIARGSTTISPVSQLTSQGNSGSNRFGPSIMTLDSPATDSPVTYKARVRTTGGTAEFGNASIVAIEVAV